MEFRTGTRKGEGLVVGAFYLETITLNLTCRLD